MLLDKDFETRCQQVWLEAWVRTAQSDSCLKLDTPTLYADKCMADFKTRFAGAYVVDAIEKDRKA